MNVNGNDITIEIGASAKQAVKAINEVTGALEKFKSAVSQKAKNPLKDLEKGTKVKVDSSDVDKATKKISTMHKVFSAFKRIAFYRAIRSAIRMVTDGVKEGLENAYQFSKLTGGPLAKSLDSLSSAAFKMKNQMGAAFGQLIVAVTPVLMKLIEWLTVAANALTQFFAALSGQTTYKRATDYWKEWGDTVAGSAKKALRYLAPFDELNVLPSENGRGSGASTPDYDQMFEIAEVEAFWQKIGEIFSELAIRVKDVFFNWDDLSPQDIFNKVLAGLGGVIGFALGGVPGAVIGTIAGVAISMLIGDVLFDSEGNFNKGAIGKMLVAALLPAIGGIVGLVVGGPAGALIGMTVGVGLTLAIKKLVDIILTDEQKQAIKRQASEFVQDVNQTVDNAFKDYNENKPITSSVKAAVKLSLGTVKLTEKETKKFISDTTSLIDNNVTTPLLESVFGAGAKERLKKKWEDFLDRAKDIFRNIKEWVRENVLQPILDVIGAEGIWRSFKNKFAEKWNEFIDSLAGIANFLGINLDSLKIKMELTDVDKSVNISVKDAQELAKKLSVTFPSIANFIGFKYDQMPVASRTINTTANINKINVTASTPEIKITGKLDKVLIPGGGYMEVKKNGGVFANGQWNPITAYAGGGSPSGGELFLAREAGPELVGRMGQHTAVMNNDQIVASVSDGVAVANEMVVGALFSAAAQIVGAIRDSGNGSGGETNIDTIARAVTRWQNSMARANG